MTARKRPHRVGLFGGTFDPPHIGHLSAAVNVKQALGLDQVNLVVANEPWQKNRRGPVSPAADRLAMTEIACEGLAGVVADDREVRRGGPTYTVDTLREFAVEDPDRVLFVVLGQDAAAGLQSWHEPAKVAELSTIAVVTRPGSHRQTAALDQHGAPTPFRWVSVDVPAIDVSSTQLRSRLSHGQTCEVLIVPAVLTFIEANDLYSLQR